MLLLALTPEIPIGVKDGEILKHHFEDQIGIQLRLKFVGVEKKKQIEKAYNKWVANDQIP